MYGRVYDAGIGPSPRVALASTNPSQSAISLWGWRFHNVRGGIDPGGVTVYVPGMVMVTLWYVWKYF